MGVYADKFFGCFMDIKEENNRKKNISSYIYDECNNPRLKELGFVNYYTKEGLKKGDITFVYDGMCDDYLYLVCIETVERYSQDESEPNAKVNEQLKKVPIPKDIEDRMNEIHAIIFETKDNLPPIYWQMFTHFR